MDISTARDLSLYNYRVNDAVNDFLTELTEEQWTTDFGGVYRSIKEICTHLAVTDHAWLKRLLTLKSFSYSSFPVMALDRDKLKSESTLASQYIKIRRQLDACFLNLSEELADPDLSSDLTFKRLNGEMMAKPVDKILLHLSHHQTHHRGMIALYLDMLGIDNDFSNLLNQI